MHRLAPAVLAFLATACSATREVYLPPEAAGADPKVANVPAHLIDTGTLPPPGSLDDAYRLLQWRCYGAEGERDTLTTVHGLGRALLIGLGLTSTATATVLAGVNDPTDPSLRGVPSRNLKWGTVLAGAVATASAGALAAGSFDERVDANRVARREIQAAMNDAAALWGDPAATPDEKRDALERLAAACNSTAYLERSLKNGLPDQPEAPNGEVASLRREVAGLKERLAAAADPAVAKDVAAKLRVLGTRASELREEVADREAIAKDLKEVLDAPAFQRLEAATPEAPLGEPERKQLEELLEKAAPRE